MPKHVENSIPWCIVKKNRIIGKGTVKETKQDFKFRGRIYYVDLSRIIEGRLWYDVDGFEPLQKDPFALQHILARTSNPESGDPKVQRLQAILGNASSTQTARKLTRLEEIVGS